MGDRSVDMSWLLDVAASAMPTISMSALWPLMAVDGFKPGGMGCHEALHMASFLANAVDEELCDHPSIEADPEWKALAATARDALADLYRKIGAKHL